MFDIDDKGDKWYLPPYQPLDNSLMYQLAEEMGRRIAEQVERQILGIEE